VRATAILGINNIMAKTENSISKLKAARVLKGPKRRLTGEARRAKIIDDAAHGFAEHGFGITTRDLANATGVTQALLYRYFASKEKLVDAVFEDVFLKSRKMIDADILLDRSINLKRRLIAFYVAYATRGDAMQARLFMRGALDGFKFPERYTDELDRSVLVPMVGELRHAFSLPDLAHRPMIDMEREVAMMLHAAVVFNNIRKNIYGTELPEDPSPYIEMQVSLFLRGAQQEFERLHAES
jgi:AcrR family transcriptional regulator